MTSEAIAAIRSSYGENRVITEDYDKELSAKCINGTFVGARSGNTLVFRGIPFAKPPVGKLRWKAPEPVLPDDRVFEAYYNGKSPIQTEWKTEQASYYPQGEDCLYLNIWHSANDKTADKPVMVFFHGGSYGWGGTADPMYDGKNLVEKHPDIIGYGKISRISAVTPTTSLFSVNRQEAAAFRFCLLFRKQRDCFAELSHKAALLP